MNVVIERKKHMSDRDNIFGERLKRLQMRDSIKSQKDFAQELGIPQPTLSAYESGKIKPTIDAIINIADKTGVSIDWLCGRDQSFRIKSMGDIMSCFLELYESNEIAIKTTIHDRVDIETGEETADEDRNWIELKVYHNEFKHNPKITLNMDFCETINKAYELTQELKRYELSQDSYEREKKYYIDKLSDCALSKVDHSNVSEDERREKRQKILIEEMEAMKKGVK